MNHDMEISEYIYRTCNTLSTSLMRSEYSCGNMLRITSSFATLCVVMVGTISYATTLLMKNQKISLINAMEVYVEIIYWGWK